jgi:hypothetical protein
MLLPEPTRVHFTMLSTVVVDSALTNRVPEPSDHKLTVIRFTHLTLMPTARMSSCNQRGRF